MSFERATYSRKNVLECMDYLKKIDTTVSKKMFHFSKLGEVRKAFQFCYDKTNCMLFEEDYSCFMDYLKLVESKSATKKELDKHLKRCVNFLRNQICEIWKMMELKEVNSID